MRFTEKDVGNCVKDKQGFVWRVISYSDSPSVCLERAEAPECPSCMRKDSLFINVECLIADDLVRLVEEKEDKQ